MSDSESSNQQLATALPTSIRTEERELHAISHYSRLTNWYWG